MSSINHLFQSETQGFQHGASTDGGGPETKFSFAGSSNIEEIRDFKKKIVLLTRFHGVEKFLYAPLEEYLPDPADYRLNRAAERRLFETDKEKVELAAQKAYAIVKTKFTPKSEAYGVIEKGDESEKVNEIWQLFCAHYDNYSTATGADKIIHSYYETPDNLEIISLFIRFTQHFNRIDQIEKVINMAPDASFMNSFSPQFGNDRMIAARGGWEYSEEKSSVTTFPQWARALHALHRIKQEVPNHAKLVNNFLYEHIGRKRNQDIKRITVEETLDKLKAFVLINKNKTVEKQEVRATKPVFYCSEHGENFSHATAQCRFLRHRRQGRDEERRQSRSKSRDQRFRKSVSRDRKNIRSISRDRRDFRSNSRDRSRGRLDYGDRGNYRSFTRSTSRDRRFKYPRGPSPYPRRDATSRVESFEKVYHSTVGDSKAMHQIDLSNNEASQSNDKESDKLFDLYDYSTIINVNLTTANHNDYSEILGDSGASAVIFNSAHIDLVAEREEIGGAILGAGGTQVGAIKYKGFTELMGVRIPCYVADITKSVIGIGLLTQQYGFIVEFRGSEMTLHSTLSGQRANVSVNNSFLFPLPAF